MLHIAGGTYLEFCYEPHWSELFGSGGRAAAAMSLLSEDIVLHTYVSKELSDVLNAVSATFGFQTEAKEIAITPSFTYDHPLAVPNIQPNRYVIEPEPSLTITADHVLRFGFLEGDAVVTADRVVYDPQSSIDPKPFHQNGSTTGHLAVVANERESRMLSGEELLDADWRSLVDRLAAEVVVVKRGPRGALVVTKDEVVAVPAFRTGRVWPLGSGDVFAAAFAHFWAERSLAPVDAATEASRAVAYYSDTSSLPIPRDLGDIHDFMPLPSESSGSELPSSRHQVYLAGPFFNMGQRWVIREVKQALENQRVSVFSPFHDVGRGASADVVPPDLAALDECKVVLAIVDGLDAGTLFEVGYARAKGIPVVALVQNESPGDMTMIEGSDCRIVDDFASAIYEVVWTVLAR
jgi:hypothetical protein